MREGVRKNLTQLKIPGIKERVIFRLLNAQIHENVQQRLPLQRPTMRGTNNQRDEWILRHPRLTNQAYRVDIDELPEREKSLVTLQW